MHDDLPRPSPLPYAWLVVGLLVPVGVHQAGIYVGQILGGFAGYVADSPEQGWRWAFTTCGMLGVIYAMPLLALLRNPARTMPDAAAPSAGGNVFRGLLGNRNFILL